MNNRFAPSLSWALAGVVFMFASMAASASVAPEQPAPVATVVETAPYAQTTWVKLRDVVPSATNASDVYVRLIAIEGEVLLPVDDAR